MNKIVDSYKKEHSIYPSELFIHGRTYFNDEEWEGFQSAVPETTKLVGVRIRECSNELKLFRKERLPVLRGTVLRLDNKKGYLFSSGFVPRLDTYPGWNTPNPISIEVCRGGSDLLQVMKDIFALTKVNFNNCEYGTTNPVTLEFSDKVGEILTAAPLKDIPPLPFRHYI